MSNKSLTKNAILNGIRVVLNIIFPLITFPYISRTLGVESYGRYQFSNSIVNYFILFAALGISSYSIREGSKYKNDKEKMSKFGSEVFSINLISMFISILILILSLFLISKFQDYRLLIFILSFTIFFNTIGMDWMLVIYEEFRYITLRTLFFQIISIVLMFVFVHSEKDIYIYTLIVVIASSGANILNYFKVKKELNVHFTLNLNLKNHITPILILFFSTLSQQIYINSDVTLLGIISNDEAVGLYSSSAKIYNIAKQLINAIITVSIPRMSFLINNNEKFNSEKFINSVFNIVIVLVFPLSIGLFFLSKNIILIVAGTEYIEAYKSLSILSVSIIFASLAYFFANGILINLKKERIVLVASIISAVLNIVLNIIILPFIGPVGAAVTTFISEFVIFIICMVYSKKDIKIKFNLKECIILVFGCVLIGSCCYLITNIIQNIYISTIVSILLSILLYFMVHLVFKSYFFLNVVKPRINFVKNKLNH